MCWAEHDCQIRLIRTFLLLNPAGPHSSAHSVALIVNDGRRYITTTLKLLLSLTDQIWTSEPHPAPLRWTGTVSRTSSRASLMLFRLTGRKSLQRLWNEMLYYHIQSIVCVSTYFWPCGVSALTHTHKQRVKTSFRWELFIIVGLPAGFSKCSLMELETGMCTFSATSPPAG